MRQCEREHRKRTDREQLPPLSDPGTHTRTAGNPPSMDRSPPAYRSIFSHRPVWRSVAEETAERKAGRVHQRSTHSLVRVMAV